MDRVWQEFYCGNCNGYILVRLNMAINHVVEVVCPNCGHKHLRNIVKGVILENGRHGSNHKEEICPPKSAYSKTPHTKKVPSRDGTVIKKESDLDRANPASKAIIEERWFEIFGGRK
jgi:hypothetical protein